MFALCSGLSGEAHVACANAAKAAYIDLGLDKASQAAAADVYRVAEGLFGRRTVVASAAFGGAISQRQIQIRTPAPVDTVLSVGLSGGSVHFKWGF